MISDVFCSLLHRLAFDTSGVLFVQAGHLLDEIFIRSEFRFVQQIGFDFNDGNFLSLVSVHRMKGVVWSVSGCQIYQRRIAFNNVLPIAFAGELSRTQTFRHGLSANCLGCSVIKFHNGSNDNRRRKHGQRLAKSGKINSFTSNPAYLSLAEVSVGICSSQTAIPISFNNGVGIFVSPFGNC